MTCGQQIRYSVKSSVSKPCGLTKYLQDNSQIEIQETISRNVNKKYDENYTAMQSRKIRNSKKS